MGRQPAGRRSARAVVALGSLTHLGMVRSSNQDAYCAVLAPNTPPGVDALLAVADGMGGHQAGEVASALAVQGLVQRLSSLAVSDTTPPPEAQYADLLARVVQQVNAEVHQAAARPETRGMGTTLTVALLAGPSLAIAHVGDSRLYLGRGGALRQLTRDHSWVAEEVARGALAPEDARIHPRRNILTRAVGTAPEVEVDTAMVEVQEGDTLLLCSDGLHALVGDEEMARTVAAQPPQAACRALVERANALGGGDNITVVVARVERLGQGPASAGRRRDMEEAKTVELPLRDRRGRGRLGRLLLRAVLLPVTLPLRLLALAGRACWRMLRRPRRNGGG